MIQFIPTLNLLQKVTVVSAMFRWNTELKFPQDVNHTEEMSVYFSYSGEKSNTSYAVPNISSRYTQGPTRIRALSILSVTSTLNYNITEETKLEKSFHPVHIMYAMASCIHRLLTNCTLIVTVTYDEQRFLLQRCWILDCDWSEDSFSITAALKVSTGLY